MGDAAILSPIPYAEYLTLERASDQKHEWYDGQVFAMAGGTLAHGELSAAMIRELGNLALTCGCRVFSADVKVRVTATGLATYPDGSVVCGEVVTAQEDENAVVNPTLLVEVLSDGTELYDRGDKFEHYQQVASLRDYVLVSQHARRIEVYSRDGESQWRLRVGGAGQSIPLTAMAGSLVVDQVYQGIALTPAPLRAVRRD